MWQRTCGSFATNVATVACTQLTGFASPNQLMVSYSDTADIMSETSPVFDQVLFCDPGSDISINSCSNETSDGDLCPQNQQPTVTCYSELIQLSL